MIAKMSDVLQLGELKDIIWAMKLPPRTAYKFSRLFRAVENEMDFYRSELNKNINLYSEKDENGNTVVDPENPGQIHLQEDKIKDFEDAIRELLSIKCDIAAPPLKMDELEHLTGLTVDQFNSLLPFMEE